MLTRCKTVGRRRIFGFSENSRSVSVVEIPKSWANMDQSKNIISNQCAQCRVIVVKASSKAAGKTASHPKQIERCASVEFVHKNADADIQSRAVPSQRPAALELASGTVQKISKLIGFQSDLNLNLNLSLSLSLSLFQTPSVGHFAK